MIGTLYIVATPIGNLEDITLRALRILKEVDIVAAEDTRHTRNLLNHYGISTPLTSYHEHNEKTKARILTADLERGRNIALVSDAGTPNLSDPGYRLVREALSSGVNIVPVPGASALTAVLSASGLPIHRFVFEGFLPARKRERKERLVKIRQEPRTLVFYEAPHRLKNSLQDFLAVLGDREVVLGREVTKIYEEFIRGRLSEVIGRTDCKQWRGEITLVVRGSGGGKDRDTDEEIREEIQRLHRDGMRVKEIATLLAERFSCSKREIYRLALKSSEKIPIS